MSEDTPPPSVAERAISRFKFARNALEGMQNDLIALANQAVHKLHQQESVSYSDVLAYDTQRAGFHVRATHQRTAFTWSIPGTQFFLPNWKRGDRNNDFFGSAHIFEHTLVKMTEEGFELITFEAFVKDCSLAEYLTVCEGLDDLISSSLEATSAMGDGQEN